MTNEVKRGAIALSLSALFVGCGQTEAESDLKFGVDKKFLIMT